MERLEIKVVNTQGSQEAKYAVIWLHGLGADYNDFIPIVNELKLSIPIKFVFPNAPVIPITINGGMHMRGWYDIVGFSDLHREVDSAGILASVDKINLLIESLIAEGFCANQIILAGFSQGGVIAYYAGLLSKYKLAGIMALSAYLPDHSLLDVAKLQEKLDLPMFICHGSQDPVISINYAKQALQTLTQFGLKYEWHEYPMQHNVCYEQIQDIRNWLTQRFK